MAKTTKTVSKGKLGLIGAAAAAAGAAAAGAYYFYGSKDAKKHRAGMATWMKSAEKDITNEIKKLKAAALNEKNVKQIIATVSKKYQEVKKLDKKDVAEFAKVVGGAWKDMQKDMKKEAAAAGVVAKKAVKTAKKAVKKAVKKVK